MAINWNFNESEYAEKNFQPIPVGNHRIRIAEATEKKSSKNNDMIELKFDVSGYNAKLFYYIVFMPDNTAMTNQKLGEFWESFKIPKGDLNTKSWIGKVGGCKVKHEEYNGEMTAKVSYLINQKTQEKLAPWKEPENTAALTGRNKNVSVNAADFFTDVTPIPDQDLPF